MEISHVRTLRARSLKTAIWRVAVRHSGAVPDPGQTSVVAVSGCPSGLESSVEFSALLGGERRVTR